MTRTERVELETELPGALERLRLPMPVPAVVLVGSAARLSEDHARAITPIIDDVVVPLCEELGAALVDGGTDAGVMGLAGRGYARAHATFALVGVAAIGTIAGTETAIPDAAEREPNHTHFLLVPGHAWGDESPWIVRVAKALAGGGPVAGVLLGGGPISVRDVTRLIEARSPVFAVVGSGRLADALGAPAGSGDAAVDALRASPLVTPVAADDHGALRVALRSALSIT